MKTRISKLTSGSALVVIAALTVAFSFASAQTAEKNLSSALGVDTVMAGVMPPPGLRLTNFLVRYDAGNTLDSNGNDRAGLSNFDLSVGLARVLPTFSVTP